MRIIRSSLLLFCAGTPALLASCAQEPRTATRAPAALTTSPQSGALGAPKAVATSVDEHRAMPRFLVATERQPAPAGATPVDAARAHLESHVRSFGRTRRAVERTELRHVHDTGRGGIIVTLRQRAHGLEVYRGDVKVLMRRNLELVAISGTLVPAPANAPAFPWSAEHALAAALAAEYEAPLPAMTTATVGSAPGGYARVDLASPVAVAGGQLRLGKPARVKPVLFAEGGRERPAYFVELLAGTGARAFEDAFRYVVAADDLEILERRDLKVDWQYRVWADPDGRPQDGPQADFTPHPTGHPDGSSPAFVAPSLVTTNGFNHNPAGQPDPWLAEGATETRGNNADAYVDLSARDGFSAGDFRATTTAPGVFDRVYDVMKAPHSTDGQAMAGIVQAFYVSNWMHDWYYDSGFNEAAGNAQADNYGRGGLGGDALLVETQDYSGTNNSNMEVMADGENPRMQAYLWSGVDARSLEVQPLGVAMPTGAADFGQASFDLTGELALGAPSDGAANDGCSTVSSRVAGKIALIDRGTCTFKQKAVNAAHAGAVGVILANNVSGGPMPMADGTPEGAVDLAVLSVSMEDGASLKTALRAGTVTTHLKRAAGAKREGALDNTVVAHEWGHLLHLRLADCNIDQCAALSEGWADFAALHVVLRPGDDLRGTYAMAIYAGGADGDSGYYGIRRAPYSIDFRKNPLTFRHISDDEDLPTTAPIQDTGAPNSEAHAAGEIWAQALFEAYAALLQKTFGPNATRTYEEVRRTMSDYIVAGLKLTPVDATFTEQRDAILAAVAAKSEEDLHTVMAAFARRGLGSCAVSPIRESSDFTGVVESFEVKPQILLTTATIDDSVTSCDQNGVLDAGETGLLRLQLVNASYSPAPATTVTVAAANPALRFPQGATLSIPPLAAFQSTTATMRVSLDRTALPMQLLRFGVTLANAQACRPSLEAAVAFRSNFYEESQSSAVDSVEGTITAWTSGGRERDAVWARDEVAPGNHVWHGADLSHLSDTWLTSPDLQVSASGHLVLSFRHSHDFEVGDGQSGTVYYDGAVIELSTNGGTTWTDVSTFANAGYGGTIDNTSGNVLADRRAIVGRNPSYPDMDPARIDLGTGFAGQTVRLRFRIGTDQAAGGNGWRLDNIGFEGIDNKPFNQLVQKTSACLGPEPALRDPSTLNAPPFTSGCAAGGDDGTALGGLLAALMLVALRRKRR